MCLLTIVIMKVEASCLVGGLAVDFWVAVDAAVQVVRAASEVVVSVAAELVEDGSSTSLSHKTPRV